MELIHTCYRIGEIDRSVAFYEALGFEERRRMPIREEAINVFMGLPGDGDALELTYNHGVDSYELGTGYNHIALTVEDLDGTLEQLGGQGIEPEKPPVPGARGRLADLLRARPRRLPRRADRALGVAAVTAAPPAVIDLGSNSFRLVVFTWGERSGHGWWQRTDEIYEAVRVGAGLDAAGELQAEPMERALETIELFAHFCRATGIDDVRPVATSAIRDATQPEGVPDAGAQALGAGDRGARAGGGGALRLPRRGQLDDALRRRRARPRRRLDAADLRRRTATRATRARGRSARCA